MVLVYLETEYLIYRFDMNYVYRKNMEMLVRKNPRTIFNNKKAGSYVISAVILAAVSVALGLAVLAWAQGRSSVYTSQYSETMDAETAKLKERLAVEYVVYDEDDDDIWIYLLNWGTIDDVEIQTVYVRNSTWHIAVSTPILKSLNGTQIPHLDMGEEGYIIVDVSPNSLKIGGYYYVRIVTGRGAVFDSTFVA